MSTFAEIMAAMAAQLDDLLVAPEGIELHIEGRAFLAAELPAIDMLISSPTGLEEGLAGYGSHNTYGAFPITLRVRVSLADANAGEDLLLALIDDEGQLSITAALDSDRTLGGVCDSLFWSDGFPWAGYIDFPDVNDNGVFLGSTMAVVIVKSQS